MSSQQHADGGSRLDWPAEYDRTPPNEREPYPHGFRVTRSQAFDNILEELRRVDARNVQMDTGAKHQKRNPNKPYANSSFEDPGVVVRFERDGQQYCIPMDRWDNPRDNAQAIARTLEAKRALARYGVETIESEYQTMALPSADGDAVVASVPPHKVLGVAPDAPPAVVKGAYRELLMERHPDHGGSREEFEQLQAAKEAMLDA